MFFAYGARETIYEIVAFTRCVFLCIIGSACGCAYYLTTVVKKWAVVATFDGAIVHWVGASFGVAMVCSLGLLALECTRMSLKFLFLLKPYVMLAL